MSPADRTSPDSDSRQVAVTFDDLPAISVANGDLVARRRTTLGLLAALDVHRIPAVGFVNESMLLQQGVLDASQVALLDQWLDAGHELGNHTFSHLDLHRVPVEAYEADAARGDEVMRELLQRRGRTPRYFRHPYLHTGLDLATKHRVEGFLAQRGYRVAPVTIYTEDWMFPAPQGSGAARRPRLPRVPGSHRRVLRIAVGAAVRPGHPADPAAPREPPQRGRVRRRRRGARGARVRVREAGAGAARSGLRLARPLRAEPRRELAPALGREPRAPGALAQAQAADPCVRADRGADPVDGADAQPNRTLARDAVRAGEEALDRAPARGALTPPRVRPCRPLRSLPAPVIRTWRPARAPRLRPSAAVVPGRRPSAASTRSSRTAAL
ncbi:MAG: hypothetical protein DMD82_00295 [Candidatus Rokuibacteriota bacterium]|nr:MAG: hypothetical protein DMD82_00295 [Candidatus Rokubacteria bacterium]